MLITSICGTAEAKSAYKDSGTAIIDNNSTAVNNKFIPNHRSEGFPENTPLSQSGAPDTTTSLDFQGYHVLIYDSQGTQASIRQAMEKLGIDYDLRTPTIPVTLEDLTTHDILIVGWNFQGNMSGLDSAILTLGITGRVLLTGHDADYHTVKDLPAGQTFLLQAMSYVLDAPGTGLLTLGDGDMVAFSYLPSSWGISTETVGGEAITVFTAEGLASGVYDGLKPGDMCNWGTSYHDKFTAWGPDFVSFELGGAGEDVITIAKTGACGITLTKVDDVNDGDCRGPGNEIKYTICYSYRGDTNCPDVNDVDIIDYLPDEVEYVWSEPEPNEILDCNTIIWEIGTLKPGDANCIELKVKVKCLKPEPGSKITNMCELRSSNQVLNLAYRYTPICANYLVVDDFESYNNTSNIIYKTWKDGLGYPGYQGNGTGSKVGYRDPNYAEVTIIHGGRQSMPFDYNNTKSPYDSNATRMFTYSQDWTAHGVKALTLWLRGYMAPVGSFTRSGSNPNYTYAMTASGTDINIPNWRFPSKWRDEFRYAWIPATSTICTITAKVNSLSNTNAQAKAGVMIRDTLADDSIYAMMCITPDPCNGAAFKYRDTAGGVSYSTTQTGIAPPYWIRLERHAIEQQVYYNAYYSPDGVNWSPLGATDWVTINMGDTPDYIGLAVTARDVCATCTAVFSNVTVLVDGEAVELPSPWTSHQDIGIKSNTAALLSVTLQDSNTLAKTETVIHDDPNVVLKSTWQEWLIPLASFRDVNLAAINKITIGVGNRIAHQGVGTLYFDNIRLYPCVSEIWPLGDFTCDCMVNLQDLKIMTDEWLSMRCPRTDLYKDGAIDFKDFAVLADNWLMEQLWP